LRERLKLLIKVLASLIVAVLEVYAMQCIIIRIVHVVLNYRVVNKCGFRYLNITLFFS